MTRDERLAALIRERFQPIPPHHPSTAAIGPTARLLTAAAEADRWRRRRELTERGAA